MLMHGWAISQALPFLILLGDPTPPPCSHWCFCILAILAHGRDSHWSLPPFTGKVLCASIKGRERGKWCNLLLPLLGLHIQLPLSIRAKRHKPSGLVIPFTFWCAETPVSETQTGAAVFLLCKEGWGAFLYPSLASPRKERAVESQSPSPLPQVGRCLSCCQAKWLREWSHGSYQSCSQVSI